MRSRLDGAEPVPRPRTLRVALPADLRHAMLPDLPANITLEPGRLEVRAGTAVDMLESLVPSLWLCRTTWRGSERSQSRSDLQWPKGTS